MFYNFDKYLCKNMRLSVRIEEDNLTFFSALKY